MLFIKLKMEKSKKNLKQFGAARNFKFVVEKKIFF